MEISGTFIFNGKPRNGATAKLWQASVFEGTPPEMDDEEPESGQQGDSVTTGLGYGGDGAFRFESVPAGEYYVSVEYDSKRVFIYAGIVDVHTILTTTGDMLVRDASAIERFAIGAASSKFTIRGGALRWV
jgi:hypothetical protein